MPRNPFLDPAVFADVGSLANFAAYFLGVILSVGAGLWIVRFGDKRRPERSAALLSSGLTAI